MLSPLDLQNKKVVTKKRKYDKLEMDEYLDLVFDNYKELYNQNQELQKQIKTLSDGVQYYRLYWRKRHQKRRKMLLY